MTALNTTFKPIRSLNVSLALCGLYDSTDTNASAATAQYIAVMARIPSALRTALFPYYMQYWMSNAQVSTLEPGYHSVTNTGLGPILPNTPANANPGPVMGSWMLLNPSPYDGSAVNRNLGGVCLHEFGHALSYWCGQLVSNVWTRYADLTTWQGIWNYGPTQTAISTNGVNYWNFNVWDSAEDYFAETFRCYVMGTLSGAGGNSNCDTDLMQFVYGPSATYNASDPQIVAIKAAFTALSPGPPG